MTKKDIYQTITAYSTSIIQDIVNYQLESQPHLKDTKKNIMSQVATGARFHLTYLSEALMLESPPIYSHYIEWVQILFNHRSIPSDTLLYHIEHTKKAIKKYLDPSAFMILEPFFDLGITQAEKKIEETPSFLKTNNPYLDILNAYSTAVFQKSRKDALDIITSAINNNIEIPELYTYVFTPFQYELGRLWHISEISVAEEHYATAVTQLVMSYLYEYIFSTPKNPHTIIATCAGNELHEIGLRMLADILEYKGWNTHFLGSNMPVEDIITTIHKKKANILAVSVTMLYHLQDVRNLIARVRQSTSCKIIVGGYPFIIEKDLWQKIGADGHASDWNELETLCYTLVE